MGGWVGGGVGGGRGKTSFAGCPKRFERGVWAAPHETNFIGQEMA